MSSCEMCGQDLASICSKDSFLATRALDLLSVSLESRSLLPSSSLKGVFPSKSTFIISNGSCEFAVLIHRGGQILIGIVADLDRGWIFE